VTYALGLDFGTSGARAIAIDANGAIVAQATTTFTHQAPEVWSAALFGLIRQLPEILRSQIQAIAINGTSSTVLLCDALGQPLLQPLMYNDDRAQSYVTQLNAIAPPGHTVLSATSSLAKFFYFQAQPAFATARYFLHQADWLAAQLHGQWGLSDYHNSLKLGYDLVNLTYPDWLLAALGHTIALLPTVLTPGESIGPLIPSIAQTLGLPRNCQVYAGTTDSIAAFLASGVSQPGEAVTSLGSTLVIKLLSETPIEDSRYGIYSHRLGDLWLVGGASNTGGAVLRQYFEDEELAELSGQMDFDRPCTLDYYPLPKPGERFPINDPQMLPRLDPRPADPVLFLQELLGGMAQIEAQGYRLLRNLGATPCDRIQTAGGGAKNPAWMAMRRQCLGLAVTPSPQTEAAYGTARLAFLSHQAVN
jgi:D-ribulokinase